MNSREFEILNTRMSEIEKTVNKILRIVKAEVKAEETTLDWINESEATEITGWSKDSLRKKRRNGTIKKYRKNSAGHKIQYSRKELEGLFIVV